jgi:GntR family transcriptional regulator
MGLFVSAPKQMLSKAERSKRLQQALQRFVNDVLHLHYSDEEILRTVATELGRIRSIPKAGGGD